MSNNFSFKHSVCFCALAIFFIACNSNQSSNKTSDSTAVAPADSAQTALPQQTTPAQTEPTTTSQAASTTPEPRNTAPAPPVNSTKVIIKKEVKVIVAPMPVVTNQKVRKDKTGVYESAESNPTYPGGERAIESYIYNHLNYPRAALNTNTQGTVNISFVVNQNGSVSSAHAIGKSLGHGLDQEAERVVSSMHGWRPATVKGRPVKARITLPITFRLAR